MLKDDSFEELEKTFENMSQVCDLNNFIEKTYSQQFGQSVQTVDIEKIVEEIDKNTDDMWENEEDLYIELEKELELERVILESQAQNDNLRKVNEKEKGDNTEKESAFLTKKGLQNISTSASVRIANLIAEMIKNEYVIIFYNGSLRKYNQIYYELYSEDAFKMDVLMLNEDEKSRVFWGGECPSISNMREAYELLRLKAMLDCREMDLATKVRKNACKIAFTNGIFDCHKKKLKKHSPKHYVLFCCDAKYESGHILNDSQAFNKLCMAAPKGEEEDMAKLLLEYTGYSMTRLIRKVFLVLGTAPNSGKSVFCDFLRCVLGENNSTNFLLTDFSDKYVMADISNSCLAIAAESEPGFLDKKAVNKIKVLTGENSFRTRQIYKESVVLENFCKLIISTNFPIELKKEDEAFFQRMLVAPFVKSTPFHKQDRDLFGKLLEDKDIILSMAADAFAEVIENNYVFTESPTSLSWKEQWSGRRCSQNSIVLFAENRLEFGTDESTVSLDIYKEYEQFCDQNGYSVEYNHSRFTEELKELYVLESTRKRDPNRGGKSEKAIKNVSLKKKLV